MKLHSVIRSVCSRASSCWPNLEWEEMGFSGPQIRGRPPRPPPLKKPVLCIFANIWRSSLLGIEGPYLDSGGGGERWTHGARQTLLTSLHPRKNLFEVRIHHYSVKPLLWFTPKTETWIKMNTTAGAEHPRALHPVGDLLRHLLHHLPRPLPLLGHGVLQLLLLLLWQERSTRPPSTSSWHLSAGLPFAENKGISPFQRIWNWDGDNQVFHSKSIWNWLVEKMSARVNVMKVLLQAFQSTIKFVRGHKSRIYWKSINCDPPTENVKARVFQNSFILVFPLGKLVGSQPSHAFSHSAPFLPFQW